MMKMIEERRWRSGSLKRCASSPEPVATEDMHLISLAVCMNRMCSIACFAGGHVVSRKELDVAALVSICILSDYTPIHQTFTHLTRHGRTSCPWSFDSWPNIVAPASQRLYYLDSRTSHQLLLQKTLSQEYRTFGVTAAVRGTRKKIRLLCTP